MTWRTLIAVVTVLVAAACSGSPSTDETTTSSTTQATRIEAPSTTTPNIAPPTPTTSPPTTTSPATTSPTTSATSPDTTPPGLTVIYPAPGQTLNDPVIEFAGLTEPGSTVLAAGRYPAEVAADGTWTVALVLNKGGNVAVLEATDAAGNRAEVRVPVHYQPDSRHWSEQLGFHFDYPLDLVIDDFVCEDASCRRIAGIWGTVPELYGLGYPVESIYLEVIENPDHLSPEAFHLELNRGSPPDSVNPDTTVAGQPALDYEDNLMFPTRQLLFNTPDSNYIVYIAAYGSCLSLTLPEYLTFSCETVSDEDDSMWQAVMTIVNTWEWRN